MKQIVLITGASSGFGKATAQHLAARGYVVYGTSRKERQEIEGVRMLQMDVCDRESVREGVSRIISEEGHIDVLINNAGIGIGGAIELATEEEINVQMNTNFMGCVHVCQEVLPKMREQGGGRIINLSSIGGLMGLPYQGYYSASKFAIEGFSEALSAEVKGMNIKISLVEPGDFATGFTANRRNSAETARNKAYRDSFERSLNIIEKEELGGLKPDYLAKKIEHIVSAKRPRLRYVVANTEQRLSVMLKRIIPGNWFVNILRSYYKV